MFIDSTEKLKKQFEEDKAQLLHSPSMSRLDDLRVRWLGKKGQVTQLYEQMKKVSKEERPKAGKIINDLKLIIESTLVQLKTDVQTLLIQQKLKESIDITLPVSEEIQPGGLHPVSVMRDSLLRVFRQFGFTVYDGPELDFDFYNFSSLNIPENHPSRDMQDTFFIEGFDNLVLRTQTSNIQIHMMLNDRPPLRFVSPGRVYRVDNDATHTPMFHQIEAVVVDKNISFAHLKGMIDAFLKRIYGNDLQTRFRPSYFPFVEPGAEVDLQCSICRGKGCRVCSHTGWLEVGGCGMIHPNVFEAVGYDSETYTGFAFGFGIDRLAMLAYSLPDLRHLFEGDSYLLSQFPIFS